MASRMMPNTITAIHATVSNPALPKLTDAGDFMSNRNRTIPKRMTSMPTHIVLA